MVQMDVHDEVRRRLASREVMYTRGREAVVRELQRMSGPLSAAELHERIDSLPLSSLYRSLTVLDEAGVLRKHHDADGLARFELADWLGEHHHHLVCVSCGIVEDVSLSDKSERLLDRLAGSLAGEAGYEPRDHVLEVEGLCGNCRR
ncbi:MAG TPA: Fur family transcriptional regulator [Acidimicrobiia bacterium]|jgi:Fur family ferric uptake transcriptional regulator